MQEPDKAAPPEPASASPSSNSGGEVQEQSLSALDFGLSDDEIEKIVSATDPDGFTLLDTC
jgi:hypothetical protein